MDATTPPRDCSWEIDGLPLAGLAWGPQDGTPVLALHGWMDHAASFAELAPRLGGCHVVAPDLSGQGLSGHRSPHATYNIWDDLPQLAGLLDRLGWDSCVLLGHSRGANISALLAATATTRSASAAAKAAAENPASRVIAASTPGSIRATVSIEGSGQITGSIPAARSRSCPAWWTGWTIRHFLAASPDSLSRLQMPLRRREGKGAGCRYQLAIRPALTFRRTGPNSCRQQALRAAVRTGFMVSAWRRKSSASSWSPETAGGGPCCRRWRCATG
ncbi:alpha/beta fold hydrolase [Mangrovicoccus ximenensis]|uniref:alpha/beta fold hydrolase n=1 Tax=Mangrovicoccus ximenensis TaxID=1911570 RepID=UPI001F183741|nr:alpha/beta fold hydrolase [Mangrovicoccus ximenensis]